MEQKKNKNGKMKGICLNGDIVSGYNWRIVPYKNPDGSTLFYLNKMFKGKTTGSIICSKRELKNLKQFMHERKFT